jgi:hypothetical protein
VVLLCSPASSQVFPRVSVPARKRGQKTVAGRCRPIPVAFSEEKKPRRSSAVAQYMYTIYMHTEFQYK